MNGEPTGMAEVVRGLARQARGLLAQLRTGVMREGRRALPDQVKYGSVVSIEEVTEAWPPLRSVFPEPFIFRPAAEHARLVSSNRRFVGRSVTLPPVLLHTLPDGILFPESGVLADAAGNLVVESAKDRRMLARTEAYDGLRLTSPVRSGIEGLCSTIVNGAQSGSWGHWIIDALPRLYALGQVDGEVSLVVTDRVRGVFRRVLEWALPPNVKLREVDSGRPLRLRSPVLSPFTTIGGCGLMRPEILDHLRTRLLARAAAGPRGPRRLYVSRAGAANRRVGNEGELLAALARFGVEPCWPEALSAEEQMALFRDAELVVGAHGSGLTGILVSTRASVIEIMPNGLGAEQNLPLFNWGLAVAAGCSYRAVLHGFDRMAEEFSAAVPEVAAAVEAALAERGGAS